LGSSSSNRIGELLVAGKNIVGKCRQGRGSGHRTPGRATELAMSKQPLHLAYDDAPMLKLEAIR